MIKVCIVCEYYKITDTSYDYYCKKCIKNINHSMECDCGGKYTASNYRSHLRTNKHKNYIIKCEEEEETGQLGWEEYMDKTYWNPELYK
jgi:hypothetical protein